MFLKITKHDSMRNFLIVFTFFITVLSSCSPKETDKDLALIEKIENNLLPAMIIEGDSLQTYNINERMEHYNIPGVSIAFINDGKVKWAKGYGYLSAESTQPVNENTLFQAASVSKPVAAMAALHLVDDGKLGLDDDVNIHLKGWKVEENDYTTIDKVTLRRILSHSAGLTVHGFGGYSSADTIPGILQILNGEEPANSHRIYTDTIPGTIYRYSGGGYTVMQKLLTDITGMTFPDLMNMYVLEPVGMINSTYKQPLPGELAGNAAIGHKPDGSKVPGKWHSYPEMAAAGLWTTPTDLLKYALEVQYSLNGQANNVISQKMTEEMLTSQINSHGLGPALSDESNSPGFSHGGANEGYRCQLFAFTGGQGLVIMTNSDNGGQLIPEILRSFSAVYSWPVYKPDEKTIIEIREDDLSQYAGNYSFNWQGTEMIIALSVTGGHLKGKQLWDNISFDIYPESDLLFFNIDDGAPFEFKRNESGEINEIIIREQYAFKKK